jgi:lipoyl(octanoyl) transferase
MQIEIVSREPGHKARSPAFAIVSAMDRPVHDLTPRAAAPSAPIAAWWLGRTGYRDAWDLQHRLVAARIAGLIGDQLLLLEHEPVLTLGRHSDPSHVLASPAELAARHIELIETERGGEVTYHGPGQLTAYPIVKLADRSLFIRSFVRAMEAALARACASLGVEAGSKDGFPGCWCGDGTRKIGAVGVRVEHGVTYHGVALNVTVRLSDFELIDACGMPGLESTSIARELGQASEPSTESVARAAAAFAVALADSLDAPLDASFEAPLRAPREVPNRGTVGPNRGQTGTVAAAFADPGSARAALERLLAEGTAAVPSAGPA